MDPLAEKERATKEETVYESNGSGHDADFEQQAPASGGLARQLRGRHMQMIAIGGSIGAGLFVGSGSSFHSGGPGSVVCFCAMPHGEEWRRN